MRLHYPLVMKNGSADLVTNSPETSGENTESILLHLERHGAVRCKDVDCPDYGKLIEVFDGVYRGVLFHIERIDGESYNVQINNKYGRFGLTRRELNRFMAGLL